MFTLSYHCQKCPIQVLVYLGSGIDMPLGLELAERLAAAEDNHVCFAGDEDLMSPCIPVELPY